MNLSLEIIKSLFVNFKILSFHEFVWKYSSNIPSLVTFIFKIISSEDEEKVYLS